MTLIELLRKRVLDQPDKHAYTFLIDGSKESAPLSYGKLDLQARAIAALLQQYQAQGKRVLLLYPQGLEVIAAFCGCLYAGVIAIPVPPPESGRLKRTLPRLRAIVKDADASFALTTAKILSLVENELAEFPELEQMRWIDTEQIDLALGDKWQDPKIALDQLAYLQYTSGSTSTPKGVMLTHYNLMFHLATLQQACGYEADSISTTWMPYFHDYGLVEGLMVPLYNGTPCYVISPFAFIKQPLQWLRNITRYRVTHSQAPNFAYEQCLRRVQPQDISELDLSCWQVAATGAEPINPQVVARFAETFAACGFSPQAFTPAYGLAENTLVVSSKPKGKEPVFCTLEAAALQQNRIVEADSAQEDGVRTIVSCGCLVGNTQVAIVHPETLERCAVDEVGEIWVSAPSMAQGYWQRPEETERTFKAYIKDTGEGPFLRTGDLGFLKNDQLLITGRIKDLIIIRGSNHYPQDIEWTLQQLNPALRPDYGAAFSIEVDGEEKLVVVQEVKRRSQNLDAQKLIVDISEAIAQEHELQVYSIVLAKSGNIFKTASGKIQRRACRDHFLAGKLDIIAAWCENSQLSNKFEYKQYSETLSPVNQQPQAEKAQTKIAIKTWLVNKLSQLLKFAPEDIDTQQSFTRYRLDSLAMVSLAGDLEQWLGRRLSSTLMYEYSNIESLAEYLAEKKPANSELPPCLVALQPHGTKPPFFCVHPVFGGISQFYELARLMGSEQPFYGLEAAAGIDGQEQLLTSIEDLAARYLEALLVVQPEGPYFLGGYSSGAYIALEMALRLQGQGQKVARLIVLDSPAPVGDKITNFFGAFKVFFNFDFFSSLAQYIGSYVYNRLEAMTTVDNRQQTIDIWRILSFLDPELIAKFLEQELKLMELRQPTVERLQQVFLTTVQAYINYIPSVYPGKITLFRTSQQLGEKAEDIAKGWLDYAQGGIEIHQIPGNHYNLMDPPYAEVLAQKLQACLE